MASSSIESAKYSAGFYSSQMEGSYKSALRILPFINKLFSPSSVLDVGCGVGSWLKAWKDINPRIDVAGVDGAYVKKDQLLISPEEFHPKDLKEQFDLQQQFDLVMSLEVGEHLPTSLSSLLVNNLVNHGKCILFSAAFPYQQGTFHINEQFPEFWAELFAEKGYVPVDIIRPQFWNDGEIEWWYRQNIILYVSADILDNYPVLAEHARFTDAKSLSRVHPQLWIYHNQDHIKATRSIFSFVNWKLSSFKKKMFNNAPRR